LRDLVRTVRSYPDPDPAPVRPGPSTRAGPFRRLYGHISGGAESCCAASGGRGATCGCWPGWPGRWPPRGC